MAQLISTESNVRGIPPFLQNHTIDSSILMQTRSMVFN